jgi:hypothetical protein
MARDDWRRRYSRGEHVIDPATGDIDRALHIEHHMYIQAKAEAEAERAEMYRGLRRALAESGLKAFIGGVLLLLYLGFREWFWTKFDLPTPK